MTKGYSEPIVLDTTVLSNFACTDGISVLTNVLASPIVVLAVRDELKRGLNAGHDYLETAVDVINDGLPVRSPSTEENFQDIRDRLDPGEAESLLAAIEYNGTLATDDLAARNVANDRNIPVTGSIGILVIGVKSGHLERDTADEWLNTWREVRGYYAPVKNMSEILDVD